jgi:hypothetical protein
MVHTALHQMEASGDVRLIAKEEQATILLGLCGFCARIDFFAVSNASTNDHLARHRASCKIVAWIGLSDVCCEGAS